MHIKLFFILIFFSFPNVLLANQAGYYILKFKINQNDIITLEKKTYVDTPLKISKLKGHRHDNFVYKLKNRSGSILFEGEIANPRMIHSEYLLNQNPSKHNIILDEAYFVVKTPAFSDLNTIAFYKEHENVSISQITLSNIDSSSVREVFPVADIMVNGDDNSRVNIVFLGDGYTQSEMDNYISEVESVTDALFNTAPYSNYMNYFNVYAVEVPSNDSGTDHPGTAPDCGSYTNESFYNDTYFDSSFDLYNIHRLLYVQDDSAIYDVLSDNTPQWDIIFVMVNTPIYGGAGGAFAVFSRHSSSNEIAIHEIGHSFAGLSDEYWAGFQYANENVNMTQNTNPATTTWSPWLYDNEIGIYAHQSPGNDWYKPHQNCKMQYLGVPFCSVCKEHTIRSVYSILDPIDSYSPLASTIMVDGPQIISFGINPIDITPNTLSVQWLLNGTIINDSDFIIDINTETLENGDYEVKVLLNDITELVRNDPNQLLSSEISWTMSIRCNDAGDLNNDCSLNIFDIILIINIALGVDEYNNSADLNNDNTVDILDILLLVNLVIGN